MSSMVNTKQVSTVNGKRVEHDSETWFRIEIGKGKEGYHSHIGIQGNLPEAIRLFHATEIRKGGKKRLVKDGYGFQKLLVEQA